MRRHVAALFTVMMAVACSSGEARETRLVDESAAARSRVVDSILPMDVALSRFRVGLPHVTALEGGAPSRDALVRQFMSAIRTRDTAAVRRLVLSRSEFGWLYYPTSIYSHEPYYQMPQLTWFLNVENSQKAITRVLERFGGSDVRFIGYECPGTERVDGDIAFQDGCTLQLEHQGIRRNLRLFGSIVELGGRYKFYSYANDL